MITHGYIPAATVEERCISENKAKKTWDSTAGSPPSVKLTVTGYT